MATRALAEQVKVGIAAGATLAVGVGYLIAKLKAKAKDNEEALNYIKNTTLITVGKWKFNLYQSFAAMLILFAIFGTINYQRYDSRTYMVESDGYDLLHYYINAKYFDELHYFRLVPALILADNEVGEQCPGQAPVYLAQDEHDYTKKSRAHALAREKEIKSYFTPERWKEFTMDVTYIQRHFSFGMSCSLWRMLLQDHGFNGTPVWTLIARPIAHMIPVKLIKIATWLDVVWLVAALAAVAWAFGWQAFAFSWIFIVVCYSFRWPHIPWAFLRYDWISSMVIGVCMVRKERFAFGGGFFAYATLMRYFPGLWLFGILAKAIYELFVRKEIPLNRIWQRVSMRYYKMAFGFFLTIVVLVGASIARDGAKTHLQSLENMAAHVQPHNLSSRREGLAVALTYRGETNLKLISKEKKEMVAQIETGVRVFGVLMTALLGFFLYRAKDWEAVGLGLIPYFMLTTSSYYYYILRLPAVLIHASDLSKKRNAVGLAMLFFIEVFTNASEYVKPGNRYFLICVMGLMIFVYSLTMIAWFGREWWEGHRAALETAGGSGDASSNDSKHTNKKKK
jgi:hypothetical protein